MGKASAKSFIKVTNQVLAGEPFPFEDFINLHSKKQKEYFDAKEMYLFYIGGRRAGKTVGNVSDCIITDALLLPKVRAKIIFASATIQKTKELYWDLLYQANRNERFSLGWEFKNKENKIITPRNEILFRGLKDMKSADLDMGLKVKKLYLDEIQTIREEILKHYIQNVISYTMAGLKGARINFTGNPPPIRIPYLEELYFNEKIRKIHTTIFDNPSLSEEDINTLMQANADALGLPLEEAKKHPTFRRNIYGEWVYSEELLVFDRRRIKRFTQLTHPANEYRFVMGVDIGGGEAKDALVMLAWNKFDEEIFLVEEMLIETRHKDLENLAISIKEMDSKYKPEAISIDTGGLGERIAYVLATKYGVANLQPAKKNQKMAHLEEMKTELYRGRFKMRDSSPLLSEMGQIIYNNRFDEIDDKQGLHSDLLDACLYAFRFIYSKELENRPKSKTYEEKRLEEVLKRHRRHQNNRSLIV